MDNQLDCRNFTIYATLMLFGCLEREFLKNGLKSYVNIKLKSDHLIEIDFRIGYTYRLGKWAPKGQKSWLHNIWMVPFSIYLSFKFLLGDFDTVIK